MFSLIITIISIALVAALALATLYYGGHAFNQGQAQAQASKIRAQGQQLLGAAELFKANTGRYPDDTTELVSEKYLSTVPLARAAVQAALADSAWWMPLTGVPLFLLKTPSLPACQSVNEAGYGHAGVLEGVVPDVQTQCYGPGTSSLYTMAAKDPKAVGALASPAPGVTPVGAVPPTFLLAEVPAAAETSGWLVAPGTTSGGPAEEEEPAPTGVLSLASTPGGFPFTSVGAVNTQVVTVENTGTAPLTFTTTPFIFGGNDKFTLGSTCGASVAAGASCTLTVTFAPTDATPQTGYLNFDTDVSEPTSLSLHGTGEPSAEGEIPYADLIRQSSGLSFGDVTVDTAHTRTFTFTNSSSSTAPVALSGLTFSSNMFSAESTTCTGSLAVGATCSVTVRYAPTEQGTHSGTMTLEGDYDDSIVTVSGTATPVPSGVLNVGAPPSAFAPAYHVTQTKTVTLTNTGNAALTFTAAPAISGGNGKFTLTSSCGSSLAENTTCDLTVAFTPTDSTTQSATLTFDTDVSSPSSISLSGTGVPTGSVLVTIPAGTRAFHTPSLPTKPYSEAAAYCSALTLGTLTNWRLGQPQQELLAAHNLAESPFALTGNTWSSTISANGNYWYVNSAGYYNNKTNGQYLNVVCVHVL